MKYMKVNQLDSMQQAPWSQAELTRIITKDDLKIAPNREDGVSTRTPTWIWCVAVDGDLFVRAYSGRPSRWYQAAMRQGKGQIVTSGETREVCFQPVEGPINERIDDAYRAKYRDSKYLPPMIGDGARQATVRIIPAVPAGLRQ